MSYEAILSKQQEGATTMTSPAESMASAITVSRAASPLQETDLRSRLSRQAIIKAPDPLPPHTSHQPEERAKHTRAAPHRTVRHLLRD
ncbi:hypothetical protein J6590_004772 [Homalodisca vitripennis]|nr:hypothetical protein J6590_004772 [Homalodisca vitripennis]